MDLRRLISILILIAIALGSLIPLFAVKAQQTPQGPWVDEVVFIEEGDPSKAVSMLIEGEIHVYFDDITDPELYRMIRERGLAYDFSYGLYYELTINPVGPEFPKPARQDVKFNPFANPRIREALNYIIDRDYIANEILGGLAVPRYTALTPSFPDYARYADTIMDIENEYRYNFEKGRSIIYEELMKMGAEYKDGKWYYKGMPIKIIFLIRIEDARKMIGEYIASQLEKLGFEVEKVYGKSADLSPLWIRGDPAEGRWHLYTGGWITELVARDEGSNFAFFYTKLGMPVPLWQSYVNDPEFYEAARKLAYAEYKSMEERDELMRKALWMSMKEAQRIWLVHLTALWARRPEVMLASDLAGGYATSMMWPYTIRFTDRVGGTVKIGLSTVLVEPWNPVGGTNWMMDQAIITALSEYAVVPDPYTGLYHPVRVKKAEVYVSKELAGQIRVTLPWVELHFVDNITVPTDAWWRFNSTTNTLETVPPGTTAKVKVVVYYEDDLFRKYKWHDGSLFDLADMVYAFLLTFDRVNPQSPLYDESAVPAFEAWFPMFKGLRIVSEDPLVIEYYTDTWYMDAEWIANDAANAIWPRYAYGPGSWHVVAVGARAEAGGKLAFTAAKAEALKVEWMNLIAGPSLSILAEELDKCIKEGYIPYEPVLSRYLTRDEAIQRYQNLKRFYETYRHLMVGNGPFYLKSVDTVAKIVTIAAYREYPDRADRWAVFSKPPVPEVKIMLPDVIYPGAEARINISITRDGVPYERQYIDFVKYVIKHGAGTFTGTANCIADGMCVIALNSTQTALMPPGSASVTVIAVSKLVGKPEIRTAVGRIATVTDYVALMLAQARAEIEARLTGIKTDMDRSLELQREEVNRLRSELESMRTLLYVAIGIAVVGVAIGGVGVLVKRKYG